MLFYGNNHHAIIIWVRHTHGHCIAIIILCSRLTLWHIFMLSSSCDFESDGYCSTYTSTCYHLVPSKDTSSCYHHLVNHWSCYLDWHFYSDTSSCYHHLVPSKDTSSCYHHLVGSTDKSAMIRHSIIILWVRHSCRLAQGVALLSSSSIVKTASPKNDMHFGMLSQWDVDQRTPLGSHARPWLARTHVPLIRIAQT